MSAQPAAPHIGYVYPAGGRQGTTFQVTVGGQSLEAVREARVSGAGVKAEVVEHIKPMSPQQFNMLREKMKELLEKKRTAWTDDDEKALAEIRKKLANPPRRQLNPAIAERVTLNITIARDAEPGDRDLRLRTPAGLTNPLVFCVGQLPEFRRKEPSRGEGPPFAGGFRNRGEQEAVAPTETDITLPATVNGQILQGGVDRFRFKARSGTRLVVACKARALVPYIPDAVPGWFQATLALYDDKGKELAYDDDYRFHPDPVLVYRIPREGEYVIEVRDAIYRGREDFVYRISVGSLPFVTSIFPLGGRAGDKTTVEARGWNLSAVTLIEDATDKPPGITRLTARQGSLLSNSVPFALDVLPECVEKEPNPPDGAQPVTLPIIVNGRIDKPGDRDVFCFEGAAGDDVVAEVCARRLDSPLDSVLVLTDAAGRQLAFGDDREDRASGLITHHADASLRVKLPASGRYCLQLYDAQRKGGPEYAYRLRIGPPRPDFELRVVPSGISVRGGATVPLTVYVLRKDGFSGEIDLTLNGAPAGFMLAGGRVAAGQDQVRVTLTAPPGPFDEPVSLSLQGRAKIQGRVVTRPAVPAEDMMQAFAYRHLVPAQELLAAVSGRFVQRRPVKILSAMPVRIPAGGVARVRVAMPMNTFMGKVQVELSDPPDGVAIREVVAAGPDTEIVLQCDAARVRPGLKGNLIVNVFAERPAATQPANSKGAKGRTAIGTLPAVAFEIVAAGSGPVAAERGVTQRDRQEPRPRKSGKATE